MICLSFFFVSYNTCKSYDNSFVDGQEFKNNVKIVSSKEETKYKNKYIVKFQKYKFILYLNKDVEFKYGDILELNGIFKKASSNENFGGFDYSNYLRQNKIYGIIETEEFSKIGEEKDIFYFLENIKQKLKNNLKNTFNEKESGFLTGLLLGDKSEVLDETTKDFKNSSLSHILAISGMHVIYVTFGVKFLLDKLTQNQKLKNIIMIFFLMFFAIFTGGSPSCIRACIMSSMLFLSKVVYRKNDFLTSLLISLDILLIINCYNIESVGMWLSFLSTFGLGYIKFKNNNSKKLLKNLVSSAEASISCNLMIIPITWNVYHTFSLTFIISNLFTSFLIGPIIILGYLHLFLGDLYISFIEKFLLNILFKIAELIGNLSFSKIYVSKVPIIFWIIYYIAIISGIYLNNHKEYILIFIKKFKKRSKEIFSILIFIFLVIFISNLAPDCLKIHFLDVGQGDSCLITTPAKKTILIDGGNNEDYDSGENIVAPYLLNNGISKIDYLVVSHGDSDHIGGLFFILENLKVENVILGVQDKSYDNIEKLLNIINSKKVNLILAKRGDKINIEDNLYLDVLWPDENNLIQENSINNNSLVFKLNYNNFSILFTGDIEKIAEEKILQETDENLLKSTVLKVAHHGSKSSSIEEIIKEVNPKIALIGVGKNNKFGHPSTDVVNRIESFGTKVFRTDLNGEILISVNKLSEIKIKQKVP